MSPVREVLNVQLKSAVSPRYLVEQLLSAWPDVSEKCLNMSISAASV